MCMLIVIFVTSTACGSGSSNSDNAARSTASSSVAMQDQYGEVAQNTMAADSTGRSEAASEQARMDDAGAPPSGFTENSNLATENFNRKIIYNGHLTMEVESYSHAQSDIRDLVHISNGYIIEFSENQSKHERTGNFVIKIPSEGFMSFLDRLEQMELKSFQRSISGDDVTEEYVDLSARLHAQEVVEQRLLSFMDAATKTDDLLAFSNELSRVQVEIERLKGRIRYLDQNVAYSTVEIRLYERLEQDTPNKDALPFAERINNAMGHSFESIGVFFQGLVVFLAGALPILVVMLIIGLPIFYIVRRAIVMNKKDRIALEKHTSNSEKLDSKNGENSDDRKNSE